MKFIATFEDGTEVTFDWDGRMLSGKTWHTPVIIDKVIVEIRREGTLSQRQYSQELERLQKSIPTAAYDD